MFHKTKITIIALLLVTASFAQTVSPSLSGTVTDEKGNVLANVNVYVSDARAGSWTNAKGEYRITPLSNGNHLVEVSHVGFHTISESVMVSGATTINFVLNESVVENNVVVVTGVSNATKLKSLPVQVEVLRKSDLDKSATPNLIENISKLPGLSSITSGTAISKPMIRGLGYNRVLTISDGVRQEGQQWGDEHGVEIDENNVSRIEVLKGPASLMYGSDAMAGVINIISNTPVPANTIKGNIGVSAQSNNRLRNIFAQIGGNKNGWNWGVNGSVKRTADYRNKYDDYVFNSKSSEENGGGYFGYSGSWGFSHFVVSSYHLKTGLIEGERDDYGNFVKPMPGGHSAVTTLGDYLTTNPFIPYQDIHHLKLVSDNNFKLKQHRLAVNIGWQSNQREEFGNIDDKEERSLHFDLKTTTITAKLLMKERNGWRQSFGINAMSQSNANKGVEQLIPDYHQYDLGAFGYAMYNLRKWEISGGLRFDFRNLNAKDLMESNSVKNTAFNKSFKNLSASIGASRDIAAGLNLKLNIARAFRAPSVAELGSNGAHEGTTRYEYGNLNLKSETSLQTDAALTYDNEHMSLNIATYFNHFDNYIFYRKLSSVFGGDSTIDQNGTHLQAFTFDQQKVAMYGAEITIDIHPHPIHWFHFQNSFSIVNGRFLKNTEGKYLPFIPAPRLNTELRADIKKAGSSIANAYIKLETETYFTQNKVFTAYNTETPTPGYVLLNASLGSEIVNKKGRVLFSFGLFANNLTDKAYQNHLSRLKYASENKATGRMGVFNMGRNFSVRLNLPFSLSTK